MKYLHKTITLLFFLTILVSCKTNKFSFLSDYPERNVPVIDSTSFSNHIEGKLLTKAEQKILGLTTIFGEELDTKTAKVGVSYLPKLSENFTSVVYYFYVNNTELTSVLVNYDASFKIINHQMIAYDEIADGLLKSNATIYKNKILLKEYVSESVATIKYNVLENGDITRE